MSKNLVIVESPAKAKTIEKFLGKDYHVLSCFGHIRDLPKNNISIDTAHDFEPEYIIQPEKKALIAQLSKAAKAADFVWLASDEDREGEAIAWHLDQVLKLDPAKTRRIVFNEITKTAILHAIENPRKLDYDLVDAQQARRVLDRLVGYEISPLLWRKVRPSLSAGRVQSVAVRLVVEREEEIKNFKEESSYKVTASFGNFTAELNSRFKTKEEAKAFLESCKTAGFTVDSLDVKPAKRSPAPPFTTSTLQQEASRKLGFSVSKTMMVAQQLYEEGLITYMRTDSVNLSSLAINMAKEQIEKAYGARYSKPRNFNTKTKGAQEAHEAIRPTYMDRASITGDPSQVRLYDLIWKRAVASQMADAEIERTQINIAVQGRPEYFVAKGEVILFDGFLKVYAESRDDEEEENGEHRLPALKKGEQLSLKRMGAREMFSQHPPRYSEASLVKKLEELGIGRPSTYAPTISTILKREYVVKEDRPGHVRPYCAFELQNGKIEERALQENTGAEKAKLFPTDTGVLVNQFLIKYFSGIVDYGFTADVEKQFDEIAQGQMKWNKMIAGFYKPFHKQVEATAQNSEKVSGERLLGHDPASGLPIYVKLGRFGPVVQKGDSKSEDKPTFAGLKKGVSMDEVTLEQALEMFKLPRTVGQYQGKDITAAVGRFGPYLRFDGKFVSIPKTDDPVSISLERAVELINNKAEAEKQKVIRTFPEEPSLQVLNGRYGPYISFENKNYKIEKGTDAALLTLEDCRKIISEEKPSARSARRAAAIAKKSPAKAPAKKSTASTAGKSAGKSKSTGKKL
ncbi:MAG: type I DNA topoisomerase [Bacteroides sp.]|nr:type I DNA topoisomerase [Ruminococcus flavefaciens]MCM1554412.1 type I DNA topoisomerase [Bacteroides sp.]